MSLNRGWERITQHFKSGSRRLEQLRQELLDEAAEIIAGTLKERIDAQLIDGPPLSPVTIFFKQMRGQDLRKLIATSEYMNSFEIIERSADHIVVGPRDQRNKMIAVTMEFGRKRIPARPHIRPAMPIIRKRLFDMIKRRGFARRGFGG